MANQATFRIYVGNRYVDVRTVTDGIFLETLLELESGEAFENSVYLREPNSEKPDEIRSFLTAMKLIEIVECNHADFQISIIESDDPGLEVFNTEIVLKLPEGLVKYPKDKRRTLAGNLGLLYSLSLYLFEKKFGIVSYHSSAMVDEKNKLIFINGGEASTGKSVIMLEYMSFYGKDTDYRVLSTEMGHFSIENDELIAYRSAVFDNVSLFPGEWEKVKLMNSLFPNIKLPNLDTNVATRGTDGSIKTAVSVKDYYARQESYSSTDGYRLVYLMPNISVGRETKDPVIIERKKYYGLLSSLIGVARQKLGQKQPSWIYDERASLFLPVHLLSGEQRMEAETIETSLKEQFLKAVVYIQGNPIDFNKNPGTYWEKIVNLLDIC